MKILHPTPEQWRDVGWWWAIPSDFLIVKDIYKSDAEIQALMECSLLHDDEVTADNAKVETIIVNPGQQNMPPGFTQVSLMMAPDPKCVARRTKSISIRTKLREAGYIESEAGFVS